MIAEEVDDVLYAARISAGLCDCPSVHIMLHRRDGSVFAAAVMPLENARALAKDIAELADGKGEASSCRH